MRKHLNSYLIVLLIIAVISILFLSKFFVRREIKQGESKPIPTSTTKIANPASVKCVEDGGKLSIVDKPEGQVGMCTFSDGTVCEEWAYFRGECLKK